MNKQDLIVGKTYQSKGKNNKRVVIYTGKSELGVVLKPVSGCLLYLYFDEKDEQKNPIYKKGHFGLPMGTFLTNYEPLS